MAFQHQTFANSGASFYGDPADWSKFSTLNSSISFNSTNAKLTAIPDTANDSQTRVEFNGNTLAYLSEIPDLANWAQYPSNHDVEIPNPYVLFANAGEGGETVRSFINNLDCSTLRVSSMTVQNQVTVNNIDVSTLNASTITSKDLKSNSATISTLTVSTFNLPFPAVSISTLNVAAAQISTLQFATLSPNVKFDMGVGGLFNNTALYAAGGLGLTIGGTAVVTGLAGAILNRQTEYLPGAPPGLEAPELVNVTTQLQISTLGAPVTSYFREIDISGSEVITSQIVPGGTSVIRSVSDPLVFISSNGAGGQVSSLYQSFGQWNNLPGGWNGNAATDLNMNDLSILSTLQMEFTPELVGIVRAGIQGARSASSGSAHNILETYLDIPGAVKNVSTLVTGFRTSELALSDRPYNDASNYDNDLGLSSTGNPPPIPNPAVTYRRVTATSYNGASAASTFTVAYTADSTSALDIYVASNRVNNLTPNGSILAPYPNLTDALAYTNTLADGLLVTIHIMSGTYSTSPTYTVTKNNTFIVGQFSDRVVKNTIIEGVITFNTINVLNVAITGGMSNLQAYGVKIIASTGFGATFSINNCILNNGILTDHTAEIQLTTAAFTRVFFTDCTITQTLVSFNAIRSLGGSFASNLALIILNSAVVQSSTDQNQFVPVIFAQCRIIFSYSSITSSCTGDNPAPLIMLGSNDTNTVASLMLYSHFRYVSGTVALATAFKVGVLFNHNPPAGALQLNITDCYFECEGSRVPSPSAGQFCIIAQQTPLATQGLARLFFGNLTGSATAHRVQASSASFTRTFLVPVQ